jgi:hypothetical protein
MGERTQRRRLTGIARPPYCAKTWDRFMPARITLLAALALALAFPAGAEPPPPVTAPGVTILDLGIYCRPDATTKEDAPGTILGYIRNLPGPPAISFRQQEVPARIGVHFGLIVMTDRDIPGVRVETWKPGATEPELWFTDHAAGTPHARGFAFDFPQELIPGRWRMEAHDGSTLLYRVEWEVLPGDQLPGVTSDCNLIT